MGRAVQYKVKSNLTLTGKRMYAQSLKGVSGSCRN